MPIAVRVVSAEQYGTWLAAAADDVEDANRQLMASIAEDTAVKVADTGDRMIKE